MLHASRPALSVLALSLFAGTFSAQAATITYNFGSDTGKTTSNASNSTSGVSLTTPFALGSALRITTSSGGLFCAVGVTANTCGNSTGLSTSTAYGLGVGDGRIGVGETLTFTAQSGFVVRLVSFAVSGFSGTEQLLYSINGGANTVINAPGTNVALDTFTAANPVFTTLAFTAGNSGNYSLSQITVDVTANNPEPGTMALIGGGLLLLARFRRR